MLVREAASLLSAEILIDGGNLEMDVDSACGSDLMSDVMAYVKENVILLTGLVSPQVIRTAEVMDIKVVVFVRGKVLGRQMLDLAQEMGITVLVTKHTMFSACGILFNAGLTGRGV